MGDFTVALLSGLTQGAVYAAVALGLVVVFGVTDIMNFTHGQLVTVGAFGVLTLAPSIGFPLATLVSLAIVGAVAAVLYLAAFRFTVGDHLQGLVLSLALLLVVQNLMVARYTTTPRLGPTIGGNLDLPGDSRIALSKVIVLGVLVVVAAVGFLALRTTWIGLALKACGADPKAAAMVGLSPRRVGLYAFIAAGILAAASGIGIGTLMPVTPLTGDDFLLKAFVVVIVGGLGSFGGAVIAGFGLGLIEAFGERYLDPGLTDVYGFVAIILVLLIAPQGLFNRRQMRAG